MAKKKVVKVKFDRAHFDLMANGNILVTVLWPGETGMLERSAQINDNKYDNHYVELQELIIEAGKLEQEQS